MSSELAIACVKKPSEFRTSAEIDLLIPWLRIKSSLFADLEKDVIADILKNCQYELRDIDSVIIRQGEKGHSFYVILSGRVSVFINTEAVPEDDSSSKDEANAGALRLAGILGREKPVKTNEPLDRTKFGKFIAPMDSGRSFGELALINDDCVRNASIISDEETHLLVVGRDLFNRCLRAAQEAMLQAKKDFVNQCSLFDSWSPRYKRQVYMSLRKEVFSYQTELVKQGQPLNGVIFLLGGQAKTIIDTISHQTQYPHLKLHLDQSDLRRNRLINELGDSSNSDMAANEKPHKVTTIDLRRMGYKEAERRLSKRRVEASIIQPGEILGDIEHAFGLSTYAETVVCTQECVVYILDSKNFERLVSPRRNPKTLTFLRQRAEVRLLSRVARFIQSECQIPLFTALLNIILDEYNKTKEDAASKQKKMLDDNEVVKVADLRHLDDFIPPRGPVIDLYGPGTVFFRSRMLRQARQAPVTSSLDNPKEFRQPLGGASGPVATNKSITFGADAAASLAVVQGGGRGYMNDDRASLGDLAPPHTPRFSIFSNSENAAAFKTARSRRKTAFDWETGSEHLQALEERLRNWHCQFSAAECDAAKDCVNQMKRFIKQEETRLLPGKKVHLKPKGRKVPAMDIDYRAGEDEDDGDDVDDAFVMQLLAKRNATGRSKRENHLPTIVSQSSNPQESPEVKVKVPGDAAVPPQYTIEEYKELKKLLQQREKELAVFKNYLLA